MDTAPATRNARQCFPLHGWRHQCCCIRGRCEFRCHPVRLPPPARGEIRSSNLTLFGGQSGIPRSHQRQCSSPERTLYEPRPSAGRRRLLHQCEDFQPTSFALFQHPSPENAANSVRSAWPSLQARMNELQSVVKFLPYTFKRRSRQCKCQVQASIRYTTVLVAPRANGPAPSALGALPKTKRKRSHPQHPAMHPRETRTHGYPAMRPAEAPTPALADWKITSCSR